MTFLGQLLRTSPRHPGMTTSTLAAALGAVTLSLLVPLSIAEPAAAAPAATCAGLRATIVGTPGDDRLRGTAGPDVIAALAGDDHVEALGGDDVVCGGDGFDVLLGGYGDDRLYGGRNGNVQPPDTDFRTDVGDVVTGGPGDDLLDPGLDPGATLTGVQGGYETLDVVSFAGAPRGVTVDLARGTARGQGRDRIVGARLVQVLGTRHDDVLRAGAFSVGFTSGAGDDVLVGSPRGDQFLGDGASTTMRDVRRDPSIGRGGDDRMVGGKGPDTISGAAGRDVIDGGGGDDELNAYGTMPARVLAGTGTDRVYVLTRSVDGLRVAFDRRGQDELSLNLTGLVGSSPTWDLRSGVLTSAGGQQAVVDGAPSIALYVDRTSVATVTGTARGEELYAETGRTVFAGGGGDDSFTGGTRVDTFDGGEGTDTYVRDYGDERSNSCASVERDPLRACADAQPA
jgi:Ca2+-binding RTX toxin-like protein